MEFYSTTKPFDRILFLSLNFSLSYYSLVIPLHSEKSEMGTALQATSPIF